MAFVVDCSVTMAWAFQDEVTPFTEGVLERLRQTQALVPAIWPLEVANVLLVAERRGRLSEAQSRLFLRLLLALPVTVDEEGSKSTLEAVLALGREYMLSAYDAAYLELASRKGLPLATRSKQLMAAATRSGVSLLQ